MLACSPTADAQGNILAAGDYNGTARFGMTTLVCNKDAFVARRDAGDTWRWAVGDVTESDRCTDITRDSQGQDYARRYFAVRLRNMPTTATFGTFTFNLTTSGGANVLVAKVDGVTGTILVKVWSKCYIKPLPTRSMASGVGTRGVLRSSR